MKYNQLHITENKEIILNKLANFQLDHFKIIKNSISEKKCVSQDCIRSPNWILSPAIPFEWSTLLWFIKDVSVVLHTIPLVARQRMCVNRWCTKPQQKPRSRVIAACNAVQQTPGIFERIRHNFMFFCNACTETVCHYFEQLL